MAALCPGVQYGLSSQESFGANKDLIFVKLTDSALRAIDDFVRNQNKLNKAPTIKFLGNEGQLSFPSHHNGGNTFNFSVSSSSDMEGPGGSLECVQQPLRGNLANLGPVQHKLRILANDDVYETTRQRMSVAEENHKNKCTREIKMNQTDIGRKVKVKQMPGRPVPPPPPRKESTMSMRDALTKPFTGGGGGICGGGGLPIMSNKASPGSMNGLSNGLGSNQVSSTKPQNKPSLPDIAKRPIKERITHLLALRPFKKIELYDRLMKDGLREKNAMMSVLKQISVVRDNCYILNRTMWNEVNEDWPFYTESDRQALKRRRPENLTPPGSSDGGSSGSGHSPTSTHPGSPPLSVSTAVGSTKRPGYFDGVDGLPTKKPRVSHFQKPTEQTSNYQQSNNQRRAPIDSRDTSNMNPRSRESPNANGYHNNHHHTNYHEKQRSISDEDDHHTTTTIHTTTTNSNSAAITTPPSRKRGTPPSGSHVQPNKYVAKDVLVDRTAANNGLLNGSRSKFDDVKKDRQFSSSGRVTSSTQNKISSRVSPDSQSDRIALPPQTDEFPDYVKEYTIIKDIEQRRRYKTDFTKDYEEYKELHGAVDKISSRFVELEDRLKRIEDKSTDHFKELQQTVLREYEDAKKNREAQYAKNRFHYLHQKLSHIKQLVFDYDQVYADQVDIRY